MYIFSYKYPLLPCALYLTYTDAIVRAVIAQYSALLSEICWNKERGLII